MDTQASTLQLVDLGFAYPPSTGRAMLPAVEGINLTLGRGEIVALIGPSGCGKTTILNMVAGLIQPTSGQILIDGRPEPDRLGRFNLMPQRDVLLPWRNALDNAGLLLEVRGASRSYARAAARELLDRFALSSFAGALPRELSGGMRQRVALIRTFLPDGDVLLDEPLGALDAITRTRLHEWLLDLQAATSKSILLVTHDLDEAIFLADRVYLMSPRPGRITKELHANLPRPRTVELTVTPAFTSLKRGLLAALQQSDLASDPGHHQQSASHPDRAA